MDEVEIDGTFYELDMSFDNVLRSLELLSDKDFPPEERVDTLYEMLIIDPPDLDLLSQDKVVYLVFKEALGIDLKEKPKGGGNKPYDLYEDASYIYASFLQDYNIDLIEEQGKLHWKKFNALLDGLREKTKFKEVINIRTMKVPKSTKHNQEYRQGVIESKRRYRLKGSQSTENTLNTFNSAMKALFLGAKNSSKKGG